MLVTESAFEECVLRLSGERALVVDAETTGLDPFYKDTLCGLAIGGWQHDDVYYFPFRHRVESGHPNLSSGRMDALLEMLRTRQHVGFNYGFDLQFIWNECEYRSVPLFEPDILDVMLLAHILNENEGRGKYGLKALAVRYLGKEADIESRKLDDLLSSHLMDKGDIWRLSPAVVAPYACADVDLTRRLARYYLPHVHAQQLREVWEGVSAYAVVMAKMQRLGVPIDTGVAKDAIAESTRAMTQIALRVREQAGRMVHLGTHQAVSKWLRLSNSKEHTLRLALGVEDWRYKAVSSYRKHKLAISSYYKPMRDNTNSVGIIHPQLSLIGTRTGRPANWGGSPNLLAMPRDTEMYRIKEAIHAREGYTLVSCDLRNAEMRLAAHYGNDLRMLQLLTDGVNIHRATSDDLKMPYDSAKRINFSVIYGIGPETLAYNLGIDEALARKYLSRYHAKHPGFRRLYTKMERQARTQRHIRMWSGRVCHYPNEHVTPFHKASDHLIQGGVGELIRVAQTRLHRELSDVRQVLQVYDSCLMEVPTDVLGERVPQIREIMEERDRFRIPMLVDVAAGPNLRDLKEQ